MQNEPQKTSSPPPEVPPALPAQAQARVVPVEVLPPEAQAKPAGLPAPLPHLRFTKKRLALAFGIAATSDLLSAMLVPLFPVLQPVEWGLDLLTAILLFIVLGWQWMLLPGLIMEAIPAVSVFPFWVLVVGAVAVWGTPRPRGN